MTYPRVSANIDFAIGQFRPRSSTVLMTAGDITNQRAASTIADNVPKRYDNAIAAIRDLATATVSGRLWDNLLRIYAGGTDATIYVCKASAASPAGASAAITALGNVRHRELKPGRVLMDAGSSYIAPQAAAPNPLGNELANSLSGACTKLGAMGFVNPVIYPVPTAANLATIRANLITWLRANYKPNLIFLPALMTPQNGGMSGYYMGAFAYHDQKERTNCWVTHYKDIPNLQAHSITVTPVGATDPIVITATQESPNPAWGTDFEDPDMVALVDANYLGYFLEDGYKMAGNEVGVDPASLRGRTSERYIGAQRFAQRMAADAKIIARPYTAFPPSPSDANRLVEEINTHERAEVNRTKGFLASAIVRLDRIENRKIYLKGFVDVVGPNEGIDIDIEVGA